MALPFGPHLGSNTGRSLLGNAMSPLPRILAVTRQQPRRKTSGYRGSMAPDVERNLTPDQVTVRANKTVWWLCETCGTAWPSTVTNRTAKNATGCPRCRQGWTITAIRSFVASLAPFLDGITQAELQALCQQNGLLGSASGKAIARAIASGRLTPEQIGDVLDQENDGAVAGTNAEGRWENSDRETSISTMSLWQTQRTLLRQKPCSP